MDPASHFLIAFLPLVLYTLVRYRQLPRGETVLVLLFATQLPDLIDKPLAWPFGIIPSGRMFAHSLVVAVPVVTVLVIAAYRYGYGTLGDVFAFGYFSHIAGDFYRVLIVGSDYYFYPNLFWPLMEPNPDLEPSLAANLPELGIATLVPIGFIALVCVYAIADYQRRRRASLG